MAIAKYKALRNSYGWENRYWEQNKIYSLDTKVENAPEGKHFQRIGRAEELAHEERENSVPQEPQTISEMQKRSEAQKLTTGMGYSLDKDQENADAVPEEDEAPEQGQHKGSHPHKSGKHKK